MSGIEHCMALSNIRSGTPIVRGLWAGSSTSRKHSAKARRKPPAGCHSRRLHCTFGSTRMTRTMTQTTSPVIFRWTKPGESLSLLVHCDTTFSSALILEQAFRVFYLLGELRQCQRGPLRLRNGSQHSRCCRVYILRAAVQSSDDRAQQNHGRSTQPARAV